MTARFSIVPADAFEDERLTPADVRVLGVLGSFLDRRNECFPSQAMVAEKARLDRSTVNRALKKLVEFKYITVRQKWPGKARSVLVYHVKLDELNRLEQLEEQAELFDFDRARRPETPIKSHVAIDNMPDAETQRKCMLLNATSAKSDVLSGGHNVVLSSSHTRTPQLTPHSSVSKDTGLSAEELDSESVNPPSSQELKKSVVFNTGRLLLTGHGHSAKAAGSFMGRLVKDFGLDAAFAAVSAASKDPPGDPQAWLIKAAEGEAKRLGRPYRKQPPRSESVDWSKIVERYGNHGSWPKGVGERPDDIEYQGPLAPLEALMANGKFSQLNVKNITINIDRLRASSAA